MTKKRGHPAPKSRVFGGAAGFVADALKSSTKLRNYGIPNFGWPKVGTLDHFFTNGKKRGLPAPKSRVFGGAVGFVADAPEISTKFRNCGISEE